MVKLGIYNTIEIGRLKPPYIICFHVVAVSLGVYNSVEYTDAFDVSDCSIRGILSKSSTGWHIRFGVVTWTSNPSSTGNVGSFWVKINNNDAICLVKK